MIPRLRRSRRRRFFGAFPAADRWLLRWPSVGRTRGLDRGLQLLTLAANRTVLWLAVAGLLAGSGRPRARRAAGRGVVAVAATSGVVNLLLKRVARRQRPSVPPALARRLHPRRPGSFSFPSGHTASAFAFATAVGRELPVVALPLWALAGAIAYSRVYFRVHYPSDVAAGGVLGIAIGVTVGRALNHAPGGAEPPAWVGRNAAPREAILVTSPNSGTSDRLDQARGVMDRSGLRIVRELDVKDVSRLAEMVRAQNDVIVIAAGGDGSVGAVAHHLADTGVVLGVIPLGTSNDFARSLGIPPDACEAASLLTVGSVSAVDLGRLKLPGQRPRHFAHAATVGLNVQFAKVATSSSVRRRFGRLSYAVAAATALRQAAPFACEIRHPGGTERLELRQLSIINAPVFGGALRARVPGSEVDDQKLDVVAMGTLAPHRLLLTAVYAGLRLKRSVRGVRKLHVSRLEVHSDEPLEVSLDGEVAGTLPGAFEVAAGALRVITPRGGGPEPGHPAQPAPPAPGRPPRPSGG